MPEPRDPDNSHNWDTVDSTVSTALKYSDTTYFLSVIRLWFNVDFSQKIPSHATRLFCVITYLIIQSTTKFTSPERSKKYNVESRFIFQIPSNTLNLYDVGITSVARCYYRYQHVFLS